MNKTSRFITVIGGVLVAAVTAGAVMTSAGNTSNPGSDASRKATTISNSELVASARKCSKPAPTTAAGYQAMFNAKNDMSWSGGDQASSVRLPDGRVLWTFADTIQGKQTSKGGYAPGWRMVHNSFVIQDKGCLTGVNGKNGREVIPNASSTQWYWPQHAVIDGGKLIVFSTRVKKAGSGALGFAGTGVDAAVFALPKGGVPRFERMLGTSASKSPETLPQWGQAVTNDGKYHYVYGSQKVNKPYHFGKSVYVARVPVGQLTKPSAWRYWDGRTWTTSASRSKAIVTSAPSGWSTSFTVQRTAKRQFQMVTKEQDMLGTDVITGVSSSPTGPFTRKLVTKRPSYTGAAKKDVTYNAMGHMEIKVSGGILGHICRNTVETSLAKVALDADKYKPQFFAVPAL